MRFYSEFTGKNHIKGQKPSFEKSIDGLSKGTKLELPVLVAAFYGLRRGEVVGLKWDAIDFERGTIIIKHTVTSVQIDGKTKMYAQDSAKTKSSMRTLPLVGSFAEYFKEVKAAQEVNKKVCGNCYNYEYGGYVFVDELGNLMKPDYLTGQFPIYIQKHGCKRMRFHDLRHGCASLLLANGVPLKQIQEWLGHSDFSTTANIYAHLDYSSKLSSASATSDSSAFNMLAVMLFLLQDYFEYGAYTNTQDIIESNGSGDILWDKTINETFTLLSNNRPYYPELLTKKRVNDDFDFFKRLHECILTRCTEELRDADLLDLFDIMGVDISDEQIEDFGDKEYVLDRIIKELNVQFNTRKQLLLKTLYAYIANSSTLDDLDCFSMFGTNSFNLVWETVCAEVMDNQLQKPIGGLRLPVPLAEQYRAMRHKKLIDLIDKPQWSGSTPNGESFVKQAEDTLIPDLISIVNIDGDYQFIIFDAKYYNIQLEHNKKLRGQPGIESVTKQYLYQLAYQPFVEAHQIRTVRNCFLMPTAGSEVVEKGIVSLNMLQSLGLQDIQIRLMPASSMYKHYVDNTKFNLQSLNL